MAVRRAARTACRICLEASDCRRLSDAFPGGMCAAGDFAGAVSQKNMDESAFVSCVIVKVEYKNVPAFNLENHCHTLAYMLLSYMVIKTMCNRGV